MGFRFRKSFGKGPFRVNLSKSGVGYSVGTKGFRYTKKAGGGTRTTSSIPGTGISYVTEISGKNLHTSKPKTTSDHQKATQEENEMDNSINKKTELLLCLLLGWAGGHKFYRKKIGMGILYLLTSGLFFIGWWGDLIRLCIALLTQKDNLDLPKAFKIGSYIISFFLAAALGSCSAETEPVTIPTEPIAATVSTTEVTQEVTIAPTIAPAEPSAEPIETTEPTEAPTEVPATAAPTEALTEPPATAAPTEAPTEPAGITYILNTSSRKFHYPSCSSADDIKASNKGSYTGTRDEVIAMGYEPCGRCHP